MGSFTSFTSTALFAHGGLPESLLTVKTGIKRNSSQDEAYILNYVQLYAGPGHIFYHWSL